MEQLIESYTEKKLDQNGQVQDYMFWYNNPDKCFRIGMPETGIMRIELEYYDVELIIKALDYCIRYGNSDIRIEDITEELKRIHGPIKEFEDFYHDKASVLAMWMKSSNS